MTRKQCRAGAAILLAVGLRIGTGYAGEASKPAAVTSHVMLLPEEVGWGQCPPAVPPGAKCAVVQGDMTAPNRLFTFRLWMPDNFRVPPHFHPADEHIVVLSGTFNMGFGDKLDTSSSRPMAAGSFMVMPKGEHHFAWTKGETVIQVYAIGPWGLTYVNPQDDPRNR